MSILSQNLKAFLEISSKLFLRPQHRYDFIIPQADAFSELETLVSVFLIFMIQERFVKIFYRFDIQIYFL
jgi:hypothetical protein